MYEKMMRPVAILTVDADGDIQSDEFDTIEDARRAIATAQATGDEDVEWGHLVYGKYWIATATSEGIKLEVHS